MPKILAVTHFRTTKRDALLGQLRRAILIFFEGEDYASVTTLAGAATQLAADLLVASKKVALFPVRTGTAIKPEILKDRKQWRSIKGKLKRLEGFFKHADRPGETTLEAEIEFPSAQVAALVFEACEGARQLGIKDPSIDLFWSYWVMVLNSPDIVNLDKMPDDLRSLWEKSRETLRDATRTEWAAFLRTQPAPLLYSPVLSKAKEVSPTLSHRKKA